jgi:hypothetical protein
VEPGCAVAVIISFKEVVISDGLCLARPSPPLVPIPLGDPSDGGRWRGGVAMRGGAGCNGHGASGKYVCHVCSTVALIDD